MFTNPENVRSPGVDPKSPWSGQPDAFDPKQNFRAAAQLVSLTFQIELASKGATRPLARPAVKYEGRNSDIVVTSERRQT